MFVWNWHLKKQYTAKDTANKISATDPLGQLTHDRQWKFVVFCSILKSGDGRTDTICLNIVIPTVCDWVGLVDYTVIRSGTAYNSDLPRKRKLDSEISVF